MQETISTESIILNIKPYRERDSRVALYSPEYGKLELVARGTASITSKLIGHLQPISLTKVMIVKGKAFDYIGGAYMKRSFFNIKNDYYALYYSAKAVSLFHKLIKPGVKELSLFELLVDFLSVMEKKFKSGEERKFIYYLFSLKLMDNLGFCPELYKCVICAKKILPGKAVFNDQQGGLVCPACKNNKKAYGLTYGENTVKILRLALKKDFAYLKKIIVGDNTKKETIRIIHSFSRYYADI
ncbi:DNA repair protein RecO [bacterium]|nr:DNA repair protein RecO [bacterium]